jgi:hypothetical protein
MKSPLAILLSCGMALIAVPAMTQTATHTAETDNNTSACDGVGAPGAYCKGAFVGLTSAASGTYVPPPGHISDVPLRNALYAGSTTKLFIHYQPFFSVCNTSSPTFPVGTDSNGNGYIDRNEYSHCGGHIEVGYNVNDTQTVGAQMDDMIRRGFDGVIVDWYGKPGGSCPSSKNCTEDNTTLKIRDNLAARCSGAQDCPFYFVTMLDQGTYTQGPDACSDTSSSEPTCILSQMEADLDYANSSTGANYFGSNAYYKVGGRPLVPFFVSESNFLGQCTTSTPCTGPSGSCSSSGACWTQIWNALRAHIQGYSNGNPLLVFRNSGAFTHADTDGGFAWVSSYLNYSGCTDTTGDRTPSDPIGLCYLDDFYKMSLSHLTQQIVGGGWKGFDDSAASWGTNRYKPQHCGHTWLATLAEANHDPGTGPYFSSSRQLPFLQVATWNDYEEGTAIEAGIDNCWSVAASVNTNTTLSWTLSVRNIEPNAAADASESTIDHYVVWDSPDGENLTQVATVASGTHSTELSILPLGDGDRTIYLEAVGKPSILNQMSAGVAYRKYVTITSPAPDATVSSPVNVVAHENSALTATSMQIYLDNALWVTHAGAQSVNDSVPMGSGRHRISVKAWYSDGSNSFTTVYVNVP